MIYPSNLRLNGGRLTADTLVDTQQLCFSWALGGEGEQKEYALRIFRKDQPIFESGWIQGSRQSASVCVKALRSGFSYHLILSLKDESGKESHSRAHPFRVALLEEWKAPWIRPQEDLGDGALYFRRDFVLKDKKIEAACLFVCGIGYHAATLNQAELSDHKLAPSLSNYKKRCYYESLDVSQQLKAGENRLEIAVAQGWRRNLGDYVNHVPDPDTLFFGTPQLTANLWLCYEDGEEFNLLTDTSWLCGGGSTVYTHVFNGEIYDARISSSPKSPCVLAPAPSPDTVMSADVLEPIRIKRSFSPVSLYKIGESYVFDLGQNIAGVCQIQIPKDLPEGSRIVLEHAEMLNEDGDIFTAPLRSAKATDVFIAGKDNPSHWSPAFTYHGFRYVKVSGLNCRPPKDFLCGLQFYTDIDSNSRFRCGSALANQLQDMIRMTERDNIHSIATDCPQRDERMAWLNDASVRFEEMPYNFDVGRLFPKIIDNIRDDQVDGAITCTAPFVYGNRPADPVCSSFLIAAYMSYLHYGNTELLTEAYPALCAWNDFLERISENGIVPISYYGDWASPQDCCEGSARSALTPGPFMSTGYHYLNAKLLSLFARVLGKSADHERHSQRAQLVKEAMCSRWLSEDGTMATGSQACQALSLRFGILPEELRPKAARLMHEEVQKAGNRITTGNLCTLYLMEMLTEYGYVDTAWELLTREEYPSWGYMMQNGATTVWERFERKKSHGMNSHCHPMYGAVGKWFYSHIAGIQPLEAGYQSILIRPYLPKKLLYAQATVDTCKGDVSVKWEKAYEKTHLLVDVPTGTQARIVLGDKEDWVKGGTHQYTFDTIL